MSIFLTGDCHSDFRKLSKKNFPEGSSLSKQDYMIVLGDFGVGPWGSAHNNNMKEWLYWLKWLETLPFTILFVDGNHENHAALDAMKVDAFLGGKVHFLSDHVIHLMRGQYYTIDGETFWTFGGGRTHDGFEGGILDREDRYFRQKRRRCERDHLRYRVVNESWWARALPEQDSPELDEGRKNLEAHGWKVDHILTHVAPSLLNPVCKERVVRMLMERRNVPSASTVPLSEQDLYDIHRTDILTDYLQEIHDRCDLGDWYMGHYHHKADYEDGKIHVLYHDIVRLHRHTLNAAE